MTKLGLKTPIIEERDNSVLVSIRHEPLASPEETILDYLETHETIRNRVARQITYIGGDYVVKEIFGRLVARGLIEKVPRTDRGSTAYRKGVKFSTWRSETRGPPRRRRLRAEVRGRRERPRARQPRRARVFDAADGHRPGGDAATYADIRPPRPGRAGAALRQARMATTRRGSPKSHQATPVTGRTARLGGRVAKTLWEKSREGR